MAELLKVYNNSLVLLPTVPQALYVDLKSSPTLRWW